MSGRIILKHWQAKAGGYERIYVSGLPGVPPAVKCWLTRRGDWVRAEVGSDAGGLTPEAVMDAIRGLAGGGTPTWEELLSLAQTPTARGIRPGSTAASRRDAPSSLAEAAEDIDGIDMRAHPIPSPTTLLVDMREPAEMVDLLRTVGNLVVVVTTLEVGDYSVPGVLTIERKTAADLVTSVIGDDKRLFHQAPELAALPGLRVVLVEGDPYADGRMTLAQLTGTMSYVAIVQGLTLVQTGSLAHSAMMVAKMVRHACHGLGYEVDLGTKARRGERRTPNSVLSGIKGVSPKRTEALLARFGSVTEVGLAGEADLADVPGIGPRTAASIRAALAGTSGDEHAGR